MTPRRLAILLALLGLGSTGAARTADLPKPVKVFILAGQSNMEGQAVVDLGGKDYNDGKGTLKALLNDPAKAPLVKHLGTEKGAWSVRDDVWVRYMREKQPLLAGPLTVGFAVYGGKHHFGPELQFGHVIGDHFTEQVLLIKTAWGGRSLYKDFRPPSSGGEVGPYYTKMIAEVREALANLKTDFPAYAGQGYELAGFVWYHGWNDGIDPKKAVPEYEQNLVNLIKDVRKEFKAPNLPVVIGELTGPWVNAPGEWATLRKAQAAAAARQEFRGNVLFVETHDFVRPAKESPNPGHGHHEFGNAETYFLVGDALGKGMVKLLTRQPKDKPAQPKEKAEPPKPSSHTVKTIEGWTVSVDDRLLKVTDDELGACALQFLERKLADIKVVVPADRLKKLQAVTIVLDLTHGNLGPMQHHPDAGWLKANGYSPDLAKCVHLPRAADLATKRNINEQPWVILHELAHAYHDQVLGFEEPRVKEAYEKFKKSGRGEKTLLYDGRRVKHYALTNHKEFFAEMTESYFGTNDFFPFNRAELKEAEPEIFELMAHAWEAPPAKSPEKWDVPPKKTFDVDGHAAFVIMPKSVDEKKPVPCVWYAPTFPHLPEVREHWMFERFLAAGIAIAGVDVGESYGSPKGRAAYSALYKELVTNRNFAPRPVLLARSRGGLMLYNWAAENPDSVAGVAGIYPVCDLRSYPGLDKACGAYGLTRADLEEQLDRHNPVARLAPLAKAGGPIFHIHGDADAVVPLKDNSGEVARRYEKLGGKMELRVAKGQGHKLWDGFFQCQELVDFVLAASAPAKEPKKAPVADKPVKVFILAGQSNMEGKAPNVLFDHQATDSKTKDLFAHLRKHDKWVVRDDVFIKFLDRKGPLSVGYGSPGRTGVELEFGTAMGDHFDEPVILVKAAWGGHSLYKLFRSPSAGFPAAGVLEKELKLAQDRVRQNNEKNKKNDPLPTMEDIKKDYGSSYRKMVAEVQDVMDNSGTLFPALKGKSLELTGFVWFQGWNDQYGAEGEYESNMKHFIKDVRQDLKAPKLPFVIGVMGQNGSKPATGAMHTIQKAKLAMNDVPEFKGNVKAVRTDVLVDKAAEDLFPTWRENKEMWDKVGGDIPYHYLGSAIWFNRIGRAMGDAMLELLKGQKCALRPAGTRTQPSGSGSY